jgi:hypothetical protein
MIRIIRRLCFLVFPAAVLFSACSDDRPVTSGRVIYSIEYPNNKDNLFLYSILPKEMTVDFSDGLMKSTIGKANLRNELYVDCNSKRVSAFFGYGPEAYNVLLTQSDIRQLLADQAKYTIVRTEEKDTMAGFDVQKAVATAVGDPEDVIELWYTDQIRMNNSNWYNPFHEIDGFLLAYEIDRFGLRMQFRAKSFSRTELTAKELRRSNEGKRITYSEYNYKLSDLFKTFN